MLLLPSEFRKVLKYINERLIRWVMRKYKRFSKGKKFSKAYEWLVEYAAHNRNEFSHWPRTSTLAGNLWRKMWLTHNLPSLTTLNGNA